MLSAAQFGFTDVARALVEDGRTEVDLASNDGDTALWNASNEGKLQVVQLLIDAKANVEATPTGGDPQFAGKPPLYMAIENGLPLVAQALLCAKADPNAAAADGMTPLRTALRPGHLQPAPAALLIRCGADAHAFPPATDCKKNYTMKHGAMKGKQVDPGPTSVYQAMASIKQFGLATTLRAQTHSPPQTAGTQS